MKTVDRDPFRHDEAIVVFIGSATLRWLKVLKPGFRHCLLLVRDGFGWILYNPMAHCTQFSVFRDFHGDDVAAIFRKQGHVTVFTTVRPAPARPAPWRPFTCVEAVKRGLGLDAPWVLTPWQLYKILKKDP